MPIVITCDCGKRLRVAEEMKGRTVRCPGCKALLTVQDSAAPTPEPPANAPQTKKSSAKVFLLVGCGCLGLVGTGIAAVVITIIVAVASHKSFKDKVIGEWVLDKEFSKKKNMDIKPAYADLRCKFEKGGPYTIHCEGTDVKWNWEVVAETNSSTGTPKLELLLNNQAGNLPMPTTVYYWDDDHIEITFPINCILRRTTAGSK